MTIPFMSEEELRRGLSPRTRAFLEESTQAGREALARMRGLQSVEPRPQVQMSAGQSAPAFSPLVPGSMTRATLPAFDQFIQDANPRDGSEFNLFDANKALKPTGGPLRFAEDEPQTVLPTRMVQPPTVTGTAHGNERDFIDKVVRVMDTALGTFGMNRTPEQERAISYQREQAGAGIGEGLLESMSAVVGNAMELMDQGALDRVSPTMALFRSFPSVSGALFKKAQTARLELAQQTLNSIDNFKRSAQQRAIEDGVSGEDREEAESWGRNSGYLVGMIPVAAAGEAALAAGMVSVVTGTAARGIMASPILRHTLASAGANVWLTPTGSPIMPKLDEAEEAFSQVVDEPSWMAAQNLAAESAKAFLNPSYVGNGVIGGIAGAAFSWAGGWFKNRAANAFRIADDMVQSAPVQDGPANQRRTGSSREVYGEFSVDGPGSSVAPPLETVTGQPFDSSLRQRFDVARTNGEINPLGDSGNFEDFLFYEPTRIEGSGSQRLLSSGIDGEAVVTDQSLIAPTRQRRLKAATIEDQPRVDEIQLRTEVLEDMGALSAVDVEPIVTVADVQGPQLFANVENLALRNPESMPQDVLRGGLNALGIEPTFVQSDLFANFLPERPLQTDDLLRAEPEPPTQRELAIEAGEPIEAIDALDTFEEATVPADRAGIEPPSSLTLARKFGSVLTQANGDPEIAFGVGDVNQVLSLPENGVQTLFAGRSNVVYLTNNASDAGGSAGSRMRPSEIDGQLFPGQIDGQPVAQSTMQAQQQLGAIEQSKRTIGMLKEQLRVVDPNGTDGTKLRTQIGQLETLVGQQVRPKSAVTPFYVVARNAINLNEAMPANIWEAGMERTPTQDALIEALYTTVKMYPKYAEAILPSANGEKKTVLDLLISGAFKNEMGARDMYNKIAFGFSGERAATKATIFNSALKAIGVDVVYTDIVEGVSAGVSQTGTMGSRVMAVLDPRALVPVYAADDAVEQGLAALHANKITRAEHVIAGPARSDLPKIATIGDIDYVGTRLLVDQYESVVVRYAQNPQELVEQARLEHPQYSVMALEGPNGRLDVYVGARPLSQKAIKNYALHGLYGGQRVKDMKANGMDRLVRSVGEDSVTLYPVKGTGFAFENIALTKANKGRFVPQTTGGTFVENAGQQWQEFQEMASVYLTDLNESQGLEIESLLQPEAREIMPAILENYFELTGVTNQMQKNAMTTYFSQELVQQYRELAPEMLKFYRGMQAEMLDAIDGSPPTLDELANARGVYISYAPGGSDVYVTSNQTSHVQRFGNVDEARTYLENYEPVETTVEIESVVPSEVGSAPQSEGVPMGTAGTKQVDPYDNAATLDNDLDDLFPLGQSTDAAYGEVPEAAAVVDDTFDLGVGGSQGTFSDLQAALDGSGGSGSDGGGLGVNDSQFGRAMRTVLRKTLGWLKPNKAHMGDMETVLSETGDPALAGLRLFGDTQALKKLVNIAVERGNPAYKALETVRREADQQTLRNGMLWRALSQPTPKAQQAFVIANKMPANSMNAIAALEDVVNKAFATPAMRKAHWQNIVTYVDNLSIKQRRNRQSPGNPNVDIYTDAAQGLKNIDWFVAHARQNNFSAETVNAVDFLNSMTHSYNYNVYVSAAADKAKEVWQRVGALEVANVNGEMVKPLAPHAKEVLEVIEIMQTGSVGGGKDLVIDGMHALFGMTSVPLTKTEVRQLWSQGLGNIAKSALGWSGYTALRDVLQVGMTVPYTGAAAVTKAARNLSSPSTRAATFARLRRLGLASTENELQASQGIIDPLAEDGMSISRFTAQEIGNRQKLFGAIERIQNAMPTHVREFNDIGMTVYHRANAVSRATSAEAALIRFDEVTKGLRKMSAADRVNGLIANPKMFVQVLDEMLVAPKATRRLMTDFMNVGDYEAAAVEYANHIVMTTQGGYGAINGNKLARTVAGRTAGQFQTYTFNLYNAMKQASGINSGIESWAARAKLGAGMTMFLGGSDYLAHKVREEYGLDLTSYAPGHGIFHSVPYTGLLRGPVLGAITSSNDKLRGVVEATGDYPSRYMGGGRDVGDLLTSAVLPVRNVAKTFEAANNIRQSSEPFSDALAFMFTNKTGPDMMGQFQKFKQVQNDNEDAIEASLARQKAAGNGAQ